MSTNEKFFPERKFNGIFPKKIERLRPQKQGEPFSTPFKLSFFTAVGIFDDANMYQMEKMGSQSSTLELDIVFEKVILLTNFKDYRQKDIKFILNRVLNVSTNEQTALTSTKSTNLILVVRKDG